MIFVTVNAVRFLVLADELNSPRLDGLGMLLHQGARAFTLLPARQHPWSCAALLQS